MAKLRGITPWKAFAVVLVGSCVLLAGIVVAVAQVGAGATLRRAQTERHLVIYSATDRGEAAELLGRFRQRYPFIDVDYRALPARQVYENVRRDAASGRSGADVAINSAMDLQIKLVNDGYAQPFIPAARSKLPDWSVWKDEAFAISGEPIVIGYNPERLPAAFRPSSHDDLAALLHRQAAMFTGRVGMYDPSLSPTGYLYLTQDIQVDRDGWDLLGAIGRVRPHLFTSSREMIDAVSQGRLLLAYDIIGSYALERAAHDPHFRVIVPQDYVLMGSRVALIARAAAHPAAARLFLDFLLSQEGQRIMANHHMTPVRTDMPTAPPPVPETNVRAIKVGPGLMAAIDRMTFARFDRKWRDTIQLN